MSIEKLQSCPDCNNEYLTVRVDIHKDKREFIYCDVCGCLATKKVWNRIAKKEMGAFIPVGNAGSMPGADAFTMACFKAEEVAVGTALYILDKN